MLFGNPSLLTRIAIGKGVGFILGLIGFFLLPSFWPEAGMHFRIGVLFWYVTVGAIIGVFGVLTWHPIFKMPFPWWVRAPIIGAWLNLQLILIAWPQMQAMISAVFGSDGMIVSPYWGVLEGAVVGLLMGFLCTRFGGEGLEAAQEMSRD